MEGPGVNSFIVKPVDFQQFSEPIRSVGLTGFCSVAFRPVAAPPLPKDALGCRRTVGRRGPAVVPCAEGSGNPA
jgi:hypothetical protein